MPCDIQPSGSSLATRDAVMRLNSLNSIAPVPVFASLAAKQDATLARFLTSWQCVKQNIWFWLHSGLRVNLVLHNPMFDLISPHIPGTSAGAVANITYARCSHPIPFWTGSEELSVSFQMQARDEKQWHQHNESPAQTDTAGPTTIAAPVAQRFIMHTRLVPRLLCSLFTSPPPPSLTVSSVMQTASHPLPFSSTVQWRAGSSWKWHHQEKEVNDVKERTSAREKQNKVLC